MQSEMNFPVNTLKFRRNLACSKTEVFDIIAKPGKRKTQIIKEENSILTVEVAAKPEDNKANIEIIRFFSKIAGKRVRILRGLKSRKKLIGF